MTNEIKNGLEVDGLIKGTVQASASGEVPILDTDGKLPGTMIPETTIPFTVPANAWMGTGPYTVDITVSGAEGIVIPTIGPVNPDGFMRETLADAQITALSVSAAGAIKMVADGDKPLVPIPCVLSGLKGVRTGYVISTFGAGGGGVDFFLNINVTAQAGTPVLSGIAVTATPATGQPLSGTTDATGKATFNVKQGVSYTVTLSKTNYTITPATATVTIQDTTTIVEATCYEAPKYAVQCLGVDISGRTITCTPSGGSPLVQQTDVTGKAVFTLTIDNYTVLCNYPAGQGVSPASATVSASAGGVYTSEFTILAKPTFEVTVSDKSATGKQSGRTITAVPQTGTNITGTTNAQGVAVLTLMAGTPYTINTDIPSGYVQPAARVITPQAGQAYTHTYDLYQEALVICAVGPAAIRAGRVMTATASGYQPVSGTTGADGKVTLSLPAATWTIRGDDVDGYFPLAAQTQATVAGSTYNKTFTYDKKPVLTVNVTPTGIASGLQVVAAGPTTVSAYTDSSGVATIITGEGSHSVTVAAPAGYLAPAAQTYDAVKNQTYTQSHILLAKPKVTVTVTDASGQGLGAGRTVTVSNGSDTVTGVTNASGVVVMTLGSIGTYTGTSDVPAGGTVDTFTIEAEGGGVYTATLTLSFGWKISMNFDATTFQTDPNGCLVYADTATGWTPVRNTNTALAPVSQMGSWGLSDNPSTKDCYYAIIRNNMVYKKLDPNDLTKFIDRTSAAADITDASGNTNVVFVIPKRYTLGSGTKITHSSKSTEGDPIAHTYGGAVYDNLAIPVFPGYNANGKLVSISGVEPTRSQTREQFRALARANGTNWHLMNYFEWKLYKEMLFFATKSFDGQRNIGQGISTGSTYGPITGQCNTMGPFAGCVTETTHQVKAYIEQFWGGSNTFIDDLVIVNDGIYAGQTDNPTDTTSGKVIIGKPNITSGFPTTILTTDIAWGMGNDSAGSDSVGLCDYQYAAYDTSTYLACVGGYAGWDSSAGPSLFYSDSLAYSNTHYGARAAFVFND